jgi:diguanylate cyclase (GGDEF)-like protein
VGVLGGGSRAAAIVRLLSGVSGTRVCAVLADDASGPSATLADSLGVYATCDRAAFLSRGALDVVIDARDGDSQLEPLILAPGAEVAGPALCEMLVNLLSATQHDEEQQELLAALKEASERNRVQERRLQASKATLEATNDELQTQLSELYFIHEFFKALNRYSSVDDVCSLVVDGLNGVLGCEISAVFLVCPLDWKLRLHASQGCDPDLIADVVSVDETVLGTAFSRGPVQIPQADPFSAASAWADPAAHIASQAAVPLVAGDTVLGVLVAASTAPRELAPAEMERLISMSSQASLSLQNAQLLTELERLSVTDRLTQLYNHAHFHQRLDEECSRSTRFGHDLALVMIDIDDFKSFNDKYGHPRGDDALRAVSAVIRSNLRDMDVAARYGGEEFVVLLPETSLENARIVAERITSQVAAQHILTRDENILHCTVSAGVATFPEHAPTASRLVEAADRALYNAKGAGKNRVEIAGA